MSLLLIITLYFVFKFVILAIFYFKQLKNAFYASLFSSMTFAPLMTILYHETTLDFSTVYLGLIAIHFFVNYYLVQPVLWKAILASALSITVSFVVVVLANS